MIENDDNKIIKYAIFQDNIALMDVVLNRTIKINKREFLIGYATIKIRKECKCYFAIQVEKEVLNELDEDTIYELMGDAPFFMEYNGDSIIYLRTKLSDKFIAKPKKSLLLNILENS